MADLLTKERVVAVLMTKVTEIQEGLGGVEEVTVKSKPKSDFEQIDSHALLQATGELAEELGIDIPKKCKLFVGADGEELTIEEVADKIMDLNSPHGSR
jgi:acyl carrier protein